MHVIEAKFQDMDEVPLSHLFGAIGTYVIWSPRADRRPTYVGEGKILSRFASEHIDRFGSGVSGLVTLMEGTDARRKMDAEIVEYALLAVGEQIDMSPTHNEAPGKWKGLDKLWARRHNQVRIKCSGHHPLRRQTVLSRSAIIALHLAADGDTFDVDVEHPWRRS